MRSTDIPIAIHILWKLCLLIGTSLLTYIAYTTPTVTGTAVCATFAYGWFMMFLFVALGEG